MLNYDCHNMCGGGGGGGGGVVSVLTLFHSLCLYLMGHLVCSQMFIAQ